MTPGQLCVVRQPNISFSLYNPAITTTHPADHTRVKKGSLVMYVGAIRAKSTDAWYFHAFLTLAGALFGVGSQTNTDDRELCYYFQEVE